MSVETGLDALRGPETGDKGFRMKPGGPAHVRDYSNEHVGDLKAVYVLVDALMERHTELIPGAMNRTMRLWRADLSTAILAKDPSAKDGEFDQGAKDEGAAAARDAVVPGGESGR